MIGSFFPVQLFLFSSMRCAVGRCSALGARPRVVALQEMAEKVGEVIEVESDADEDSQAEPEVSRVEALGLCQRLEGACLRFGNADPTLPLELLKQIRLFRAHLRRDELLHGTQTTIDSYFISP
jgi:hypothetical protein